MGARDAAAEYAGLGYSPIPLYSDSNKPIGAWTTLSIPSLWLGIDEGAHIGLRAGDGIAFLDFDDKNQSGTSAAGMRYLGGLGYYAEQYPLIRTPSGGAHVYIAFQGGLPGHWRNFAPDFGAGEFRFGSAAMVVAPPSTRDGIAYERVAGDLRQLPHLDVADVLPILSNKDTGAVDDVAAAILATAPRDAGPGRIGRGTWRLLRGDVDDKYRSRSEAEAAILAGLVNVGLDFGAILGLFRQYPAAGKFRELDADNSQRAIGYLRHTWENAVKWTSTHPSEGRKRAFLAVQWAQERPWPGRTGRTDFTCFVAHALTAYTSGKVEYNLSQRELAERAGIGQDTAHKANRRLVDADLIARVKGQHDTCGVLWRLGESAEILSIPHVGGYEGLIGNQHFGDALAHDAFRYRGFGKSASQLWTLLRAQPMTARELAERSGRGLRTVYANLAKLGRIVDAATGEVFRLVEPGAGDSWRALDADLDAIATAIGTAGRGAKQRVEHARQRAAWHGAIERQKAERVANAG